VDISGCIVTIDAMGTQKSIAEKIIAALRYILSLKDNHPTLHQQVRISLRQRSPLGLGVDVEY